MSTPKENSPSVEDNRKAIRFRLDIQGLDETCHKFREMRDLLREIQDLHNEIFNCKPMCDIDQISKEISQAVLLRREGIQNVETNAVQN